MREIEMLKKEMRQKRSPQYLCSPVGRCAVGGAQCGDRCVDSRDAESLCDLEGSVYGDCRHIPKCDSQAECVYRKQWGPSRRTYRCQCNSGWTGNGIQVCRNVCYLKFRAGHFRYFFKFFHK